MDLSSSKTSLKNLPMSMVLVGHDLTLDRLGPKNAPEAYQLVCMEARQGQDMGQDEFASEQHLQTHILKADSFGVFDTYTGELVSVIMLAPSTYSWSADPLFVDGIIICETKIKSSIIQSLIQLAKTLAMSLNYEGLFIEAFRTSPLVTILRAEGFAWTGCNPNSGNLMNKGWTDSLIFCKELQRRKPEIKNRLEGEEVAKIVFMVQKPRLTFLPKIFKTPTGLEVIVRYMRDEEIPHVYSMYKEASEKGHGYSTDEFDTMETFRYYVIDHGHPFIIEDPVTSKILAALTITPCEFCRSVDPPNCTAYIVVDPASQGMQLGTMGSVLFTRLGSKLGYTGCIADIFVTNFPGISVNRKNGLVITGFIPKAAIGQNGRLEDAIMLYKCFENESKFMAKL